MEAPSGQAGEGCGDEPSIEERRELAAERAVNERSLTRVLPFEMGVAEPMLVEKRGKDGVERPELIRTSDEVDARARAAPGTGRGESGSSATARRRRRGPAQSPFLAPSQAQVLRLRAPPLRLEAPFVEAQRALQRPPPHADPAAECHPLFARPPSPLWSSLRSGQGYGPRTKDTRACPPPRRVRRLAWLGPPPGPHHLPLRRRPCPAAKARTSGRSRRPERWSARLVCWPQASGLIPAARKPVGPSPEDAPAGPPTEREAEAHEGARPRALRRRADGAMFRSAAQAGGGCAATLPSNRGEAASAAETAPAR